MSSFLKGIGEAIKKHKEEAPMREKKQMEALQRKTAIEGQKLKLEETQMKRRKMQTQKREEFDKRFGGTGMGFPSGPKKKNGMFGI